MNNALSRKLHTDEDITGEYVTVRDFVDVKGRKALKGMTGRAVMCPTEVTYLDCYAGEVSYRHSGREHRAGDRWMLVDISQV